MLRTRTPLATLNTGCLGPTRRSPALVSATRKAIGGTYVVFFAGAFFAGAFFAGAFFAGAFFAGAFFAAPFFAGAFFARVFRLGNVESATVLLAWTLAADIGSVSPSRRPCSR